MIVHHPSPELLLDYAAGLLHEGVALVVATHVSLCCTCRQTIGGLEALGGVMLEDHPDQPAEMGGEALLAATLARLDEPEPPAKANPAALDPETLSLIPSPLRRYLNASLGDLPWTPVGRVAAEYRLPLPDQRIKTALMQLHPDRVLPKHSHVGHEYLVVLDGGYTDAGERYRRGDFGAYDRSILHSPHIDVGGECLCLAALDAPLKFPGLFGRLLGLFVKT